MNFSRLLPAILEFWESDGAASTDVSHFSMWWVAEHEELHYLVTSGRVHWSINGGKPHWVVNNAN